MEGKVEGHKIDQTFLINFNSCAVVYKSSIYQFGFTISFGLT